MIRTSPHYNASTLEEQEKIRRAIVTAMFSDDELYEHLVLKGGNALRLVHGLVLTAV